MQKLEELDQELRNLGVEVDCFASKAERYLTHTQELISRQNAASPTADGSSHREEGNNFPTDPTSQPDDFASYDLSGSNSTGTESIGTGTGTGNLRQRTVDLDSPVSQSEGSGTSSQKHARSKGSQRSLHTTAFKSVNDPRLS